jgi:hypothetical protein
MNITMAAFHGRKKPLPLENLIRMIRDRLDFLLTGSSIKDYFIPSDTYRIHVTIIGMESDFIHGSFYGHWFRENQKKKVKVNIQLFTEILRDVLKSGKPGSRQKDNPLFTIRFGGFRKAYCTCADDAFQGWECPTGSGEFHSCGRSPFEGSFYAYAPGPVVMTGWPVSPLGTRNGFPHSLSLFRRRFEKAGFLDKYHSDAHPQWMNDDCHLKLGLLSKEIETLPAIIDEMRNFFSAIEPVFIDIFPRDIDIILYHDTSLAEESVIQKLPLTGAVEDPDSLYRLWEFLGQ